MPISDQGELSDRYRVIPRTLIFLTRAKMVLLLRGASHKRLWANQYNGIGGHIERGEDVLTAARREVQEETGLPVRHLWLCGTVTINTGADTGIALFVFKGECRSGEPQHSQEGTLQWVPFAEIDTLPLVQDLSILLPRILSMRTGEPPFAAHYAYDAEEQLQIYFAE